MLGPWDRGSGARQRGPQGGCPPSKMFGRGRARRRRAGRAAPRRRQSLRSAFSPLLQQSRARPGSRCTPDAPPAIQGVQHFTSFLCTFSALQIPKHGRGGRLQPHPRGGHATPFWKIDGAIAAGGLEHSPKSPRRSAYKNSS